MIFLLWEIGRVCWWSPVLISARLCVPLDPLEAFGAGLGWVPEGVTFVLSGLASSISIAFVPGGWGAVVARGWNQESAAGVQPASFFTGLTLHNAKKKVCLGHTRT